MLNCFTNKRPLSRTTFRGAFTLLEIALVLGVSGLVLAGIWTTASAVWQSYRISKLTDQITKVVQNVRAQYAGVSYWRSSGTCWGPYVWSASNITDITQCADGLGLIPTEMERNPSLGPGGGPIDHNLVVGGIPIANAGCGGSDIDNSSFCVEATNAGNPGLGRYFPAINITLFDVGQSDCIRLISQLSAAADPISNLINIGVNGNNWPLGEAPANPTTALTLCSNSDPTTTFMNTIALEFSLH